MHVAGLASRSLSEGWVFQASGNGLQVSGINAKVPPCTMNLAPFNLFNFFNSLSEISGYVWLVDVCIPDLSPKSIISSVYQLFISRHPMSL
jgi:hypothetical protein